MNASGNILRRSLLNFHLMSAPIIPWQLCKPTKGALEIFPPQEIVAGKFLKYLMNRRFQQSVSFSLSMFSILSHYISNQYRCVTWHLEYRFLLRFYKPERNFNFEYLWYSKNYINFCHWHFDLSNSGLNCECQTKLSGRLWEPPGGSIHKIHQQSIWLVKYLESTPTNYLFGDILK